jgi:hypothetical protein
MLNNILFLSQGVQIAMLLFLFGLVMVFMKMSALEKRVKNLEQNQRNYISYEDYMESFHNMFTLESQGKNVASETPV